MWELCVSRYRIAGVCYACFCAWSRQINRCCNTCGRADLELGLCQNPLCNRDRWYDRNITISYREGVLHNRMDAYKFNGRRGWALIFARILLGFMNANVQTFQGYDLIIANPAYPPGQAATSDTGRVLSIASQIDQYAWPFDGIPQAIEKRQPTTSMKGKGWQQRAQIAETELRAALAIPNRQRTEGHRVLVYDDLYTTGHTLNEVARCLINVGGARQVTGISLARQLRGT